MESTGVYAGRMPRGSYFWVITALGLLSLWLSYEYATIDLNWRNKDVSRPFMIILMLAVAVAQSIPVVRRLHDIGKSGYNYWLLLLPIYNIYLSLVLLCRPSAVGTNRFGAQPTRNIYSGRMNRAVYFTVILVVGLVDLPILHQIRTGNGYDLPVYIMFAIFLYLVRSIPVVRRFHDMGKSGCHFWFLFVPIYNIVVGFRLLFKRGQSGPNAFGPDPLSPDHEITQPEGPSYVAPRRA